MKVVAEEVGLELVGVAPGSGTCTVMQPIRFVARKVPNRTAETLRNILLFLLSTLGLLILEEFPKPGDFSPEFLNFILGDLPVSGNLIHVVG